MAVDWDKVDKKIPTAPTPAGQQARKDIFDGMDPNGNGLLTLTECQAGLPNLVAGLVKTRDHRPAIKAAFHLARSINAEEAGNKKEKKAEANMIDRSEFHGLLVAWRQYLELDVMFDSIDKSGDRMLSFKEVEKALPKLETWNLGGKAQVKRKFPADEWAEALKYEDFADWCIQRRMGGLNLTLDQNDAFATIKAAVDEGTGCGGAAGALLKAFEKWDTDGNGSISTEELFSVMNALDSSFTQEQASQLFEAADSNKDGKIDYAEFTKWVSA